MIVSIINSRSARVASLLPAIIVTHPRNKPYHTRSTPRIILFPACISPFLFRRSGLNIHQTPPQTSIYPITKPTSCCREHNRPDPYSQKNLTEIILSDLVGMIKFSRGRVSFSEVLRGKVYSLEHATFLSMVN